MHLRLSLATAKAVTAGSAGVRAHANLRPQLIAQRFGCSRLPQAWRGLVRIVTSQCRAKTSFTALTRSPSGTVNCALARNSR